MSAAHTPGPWKVCEHSWSNTSISAGDDCICALDINHATEDTQDALELVMAANASLIAAAPDLLEACEEALGALNGAEHALPGYVVAQLERAIAKATGAAS